MSEKIQYIGENDWQQVVLENKGSVVVDFYSTECPPCEALAAKYDSFAALYGDHVKFVKIFRQENRDLATRLGVSSSPTVLYFRNGVEVGTRLSGAIRRAALEEGIHALIDPSLAAALKAKEQPVSSHWDVAIIGGGPAGLAAGIYTAQAKLRTIIIEKSLGGGNVALTHQVSNYPGFEKPQAGFMLAHYFTEQAHGAGVEFRKAADITSVDLKEKKIVVDGLETITAKKIIVATGSSPRPLNVEGEKTYYGRGISYCATCDAKYYEGKHVVVIGGGNTAIEEALFIAKFASKITIVHQFGVLQANKQAADQALAHEKFEFVFEHEPREFKASDKTVNEVVVENLKTGQRRSIACDGVFIFAGMKPNLDLFPDKFALDQWGYINIDEQMHTNIPDVFAAGDVAHKMFRQITTAVSDGTVAAIVIAKELGA